MKKLLFLGILALTFNTLLAQKKNTSRNIDLGFGIGGNQQLLAGSFVQNWGIGKKKKLDLGIGIRMTNSFATDKYYTTAHAKLTSGKTGPGVLFAEDIPANIDSFFVGKTQINAINISFNSEYHFTNKFSAGFNIDVIGFSFGAQKTGTYIRNGANSLVTAKPTGFNLLLISDNDLGSLNSELFIRYKINNKWSI
ncbi:MAG: hypothetical protein RIQ89_1783, partial [Bacteroidota bacterium]